MSKNNIIDTADVLRKLINEGFKEYDGDIREEALECLEELVSDRNLLQEQNDGLKGEVIKLTNWYDEEIDFGTGKLYYKIHRGSAITLNELMGAIKEAAMIMPLTRITDSIKRI